MKHLSTYVHAHATVQLDEGERFVAHDGKHDLEIFEVRWSGERFEGTGRIFLSGARMSEPTCVQLRPDTVPLGVRRALASARFDAACEALNQSAAHLDELRAL
jgi:hypothetical protein